MIEVSSCVDELPVSEDEIVRFCEFAVKQVQLEGFAEISITFVDEEQIAQINQEYRQQDKPTDILTFNLDSPVPGCGLGDIYLCIPQMQDQWGLGSVKSLILFLVAHGVLHLSGMTHDTEEDYKNMVNRQQLILEAYQG
jgi:probable rRNA maturation factor